MSEKVVRCKSIRVAAAGRPSYEAPVVVDLRGPAGGVGNGCADGSSNLFCENGVAAIDDCWEGAEY
jgi:hypothetical protein